ncbi:MAG: DUF4365 domain-containing protein [Ruminococcus sp.]
MDSGLTSRLGVSKADCELTKLGFAFREQTILDYGIDAIIEAPNSNESYMSGKLIAAQIKTGDSYFDEKKDESIVYRGELKHLDYWLNHSLPVIIILYSPEQDKCIWASINKQTVIKTEKGWKINIPYNNDLHKAEAQLLELANSQSEFQRRWASLLIAKEWMLDAIKQNGLILEVQEWVNKCSGKGDFILKKDDEKEKEVVIFEKTIFGFGTRSYELVITDLFPWADICVDESFYELNQDEEFVEIRKEQDNFPNIYPYRNGAGEVDFYRLKLTVNRVGKAFLEINDFLENNKFYIIDKIF